MIKLSKVGGDVKIEHRDDICISVPLTEKRRFTFNKKDPDNPKVDIIIGDFKAPSVPLSQLTIADVIPTTEEEFDTQKALVFPSAGIASTSLLQSAMVTLTDAQIKNSPSSYHEIVASPGTNKLLVFQSAVLILDTTAGGYTNVTNGNGFNSSFVFVYGENSFAASNFGVLIDFMTTAADKVIFFSSPSVLAGTTPYLTDNGDVSEFDVVNKPINFTIYNDDGNFTGGNAANTLKVTVYYIEVDL
jgi:hypothetical protein